MRIVILDDYQGVARDMADWRALEARADIEVERRYIGDRAAMADRLAGVEIVVAMRERTVFDRDMLGCLPDLKLLVTTGMVNASIDLDAAREQGVTVCGTSSGGPDAAELAFALMIALARRIPQEDRALRKNGAWQTGLGMTLNGKTLGLLGFGKLGKRMAGFGAAFGMRVQALSRSLTDADAADHGVKRAETLGTLLETSDVLSIHVPLSRATGGLIGADGLEQMKPGAILVNTSRGPIVEENALIAALRSGRIQAGLDVFATEPLPADHPFLHLPNVLVTPHIGYVTEDSYRVYFGGAVEAIAAWLDGDPVRVLT
ncbi:D-2-hydroxyacid dehydrogenase family protein [Palleronia abyssalis]|uniref:Hydroxypyruvate reductase n=1 Tax=Palleronia abyssalis TaxID=1501240 RepID=A0A2R8BZ68_9RHOB|nr:D-2-hydroxyacid dehydrogenase family protein [Palleronia abyssalis]SPJ25413.1 Hydroxypyruvate reductase [Palleronia abyssalis]